jgi:hypothetical protein
LSFFFFFKAFVGWVNAHLAKERTKIREISDFCDGTKFITLLEILEKRKLRQFKATNRTPRHRFDQLETLGLVIRHLQTLKQNLTGISGDGKIQLKNNFKKSCIKNKTKTNFQFDHFFL